MNEQACFDRLERARFRKQWQARGALVAATAGCAWLALNPVVRGSIPTVSEHEIRAEMWNKPQPGPAGASATRPSLPADREPGEPWARSPSGRAIHPSEAEQSFNSPAGTGRRQADGRSASPQPEPARSLKANTEPASEPAAALANPLEPTRSAAALEGPEQALAKPLPPVDRGTLQVSEADCRTHSRQGRAAQAIECFEQLSRGSGIQADVATYEVARLSATSGTDPLQVLSLLDRYQQRFPEGVMRGEVDWLRVQSLYRSGRHRAALNESDALLSTSAGRVLAAEVHWLRGIIFEERLLDFGRAASEFVTFVGMPGARADEGEWRRARCLERLGRRAEATDAYRRYLERSDARRGAEARSKLEELAGTRRSPLSN